VHVSQVRDVMLELQLGDVACSWVESSKPALRSLRAMAAQMELADLCAALDDFCAAVDAAVAGAGASLGGDRKDELVRRYQRLIELIPQAFALDGERDRREPIILESLLRQVDGVEQVTLDKLFAVGLGRLDALLRANADDLAAAAGVQPHLAAAIVERLRRYRATGGAAVAAPDIAAEHRELRALVAALRTEHEGFERAASGWSDDDRARKRELRKQRDQTFLQVKVSLARLGERDRIARLERLPFNDRITELEQFLAATARTRREPTSPRPGAHAAPGPART